MYSSGRVDSFGLFIQIDALCRFRDSYDCGTGRIDGSLYMEMNDLIKNDSFFFFVCIFVSLLVGRFLGRISGKSQIQREMRGRESEKLTQMAYNVILREENGIDHYYDLLTERFIRSGVTPEELLEELSSRYPDKKIRLIISREHE